MLSQAIDAPVFLRHEGRDLILAFADHAQRRTLHASGRQSAAHLLPQQWREVEADQVIECAPSLLRIHQVKRQFAWRGDRGANGVLCYLVKHHAMHLLAVQLAALLEYLEQMPG